ncbi:PEPxxWA-CTERM sorting domain-containing protein [Sphingomonas sp. MMS24-J13]|uniref:PEPxxWA-CTERM sorting domain-containing protein n=1 Tax=Sphingomonas sp. MMS24-J13 TaxID=3238686 RepID=UPI00384BF75D
MKVLISAAFAIALGAAAPSSAATLIFDLKIDGSSSGLGGTNFGTVSVTENAGSLVITEQLKSGYAIHKTTASNHQALVFSLVNDPAISIKNISTASIVRAATVDNRNRPITYTAPGISGSFDYGLSCTGCGNGVNSTLTQYSFTVSSSSGALTLNSLAYNVFNGSKVYFASDLINKSSGVTGNVGAVLRSNVGSVPEPASWAMMIAGFGAVGTVLRRQRKMELTFG